MTSSNNTETNIQNSVGIIGCGWLGTALAITLVQQNIFVVGTTQNESKLEALKKLGVNAEQFSLPFDEKSVTNQLIFQCRSLIICIPPQIRYGKSDYAEKITQIIKAAENGSVEKIILLSTTAIYGDLSGDIDETNQLNKQSKKVALLAEAEQEVLLFSKQSIVLRLGGLVGDKRHPGSFLRHKRLLSAPNAYVNLVHQQDVIGVIVELLSKGVSGVFNVVNQMNMSKRDFYSIAANTLNLSSPNFDENTRSELGRQVASDKVRNSLNYQFQFDDLVAWMMKNSRY